MFIFFIFVVDILLFWVNYKSGTFLVGWDALFPELNLKENLQRNIFSIWQQYRGLGLLDGMSFAANLPHTVFVSFLSLILPKNLIRYFFVFLMHFLGGLGIYFLSGKLMGEKRYKKEISFIVSLFYLFNFATVQMFFAPFEVFAVHFAFLPFLILAAISFLEKGNKKTLGLFALVSFLATPQSHVPTLFIVYFLALAVFCVFHWLGSGQQQFKRVLFIILIAIFTNSFWGIPYFYSALDNSLVISQSKINLMSTEEIILKNKAFGDFKNVVLLKGSNLNFVEIQGNLKNDYMMKEWRVFLERPFWEYIGFFFFSLGLIGFLSAIFQKEKRFYSAVFLFFISFSMLGQEIPVLNLLPQTLAKTIPLFSQIFRFSFTKFSILHAFSFSLLLGKGVLFLVEKVNKKPFLLSFSFGFIVLLFLYSFPIWKGQFLYDNLQLKIPQEYLETINFFNGRNKSSRVSPLPQPSFWGWTYTNWGYRGSGFLWFGIPQPTLDGAFLPWSRENENYYNEVSYALYSKNLPLFENVLEKYQINWLLVDGNVVSYTSPKSLYLDELEELIAGSSKISLAAQFGKIKIYQVNLTTRPQDFVFLIQNLPKIEPVYKWGNYDKAFEEYGNYFTDRQSLIADHQLIYYPFRSLFTGRRQEELEFKVKEEKDSFVFWTKVPEEFEDGKLEIASGAAELVEISPENLGEQKEFWPKANFENGIVEVRFPKIKGIYSYDLNLDKDWLKKQPQSCDAFNRGQLDLEKIKIGGQEGWRLSALNQASCLDLYLPNLENRYSYLITVESRYQEGRSLLFWLENLQSRKADIETYLPKYTSDGGRPSLRGYDSSEVLQTSYFIQPPMAQDGLSYSLHFNNISIGRVKSVNDLVRITVNPIPYKFLTGIKIIKEPLIANYQLLITNFTVSHPNESFYKVEIPTKSLNPYNPKYLVLSQSYSSDWLAFEKNGRFSFKILKDHVMVNNWANGWKLPITNHQSLTTIYIFFWPQLLEYFGFLLLLVTPVIIWKFKP